MMTHRMLLLASVTGFIFMLAGCHAAPNEVETPSGQAMEHAPTDARFQATIHALTITSTSVPDLNADRLARQTDLAATLAGLGETRVLYHVDQRVDLAGDRVTVEARVPTVTAARITDQGDLFNTIDFTQTGAMFDITGTPLANDRFSAAVKVEVATMTDSSVMVSERVTSPIFHKLTMRLKGQVVAGEPAVLISAETGSTIADGEATVYVAQVVIGDRP